jgi:hypothetical protein
MEFSAFSALGVELASRGFSVSESRMINTLLALLVTVALLAHTGAWIFTPFYHRTGEPSFFAFEQNDLEVRSVGKYQLFHALKWFSVGVAAAVLIYDFTL